MGIMSKVKSGASHAKTTISHVAEKVTPSIAKPALHKVSSVVKEHHEAISSVAHDSVDVVSSVGSSVGSTIVDHQDEIKTTISVAAKEVKKDAEIVKSDTIAVTKEVGNNVEKVGKTAVSGFKNMYIYAMVALGGIIIIKFL